MAAEVEGHLVEAAFLDAVVQKQALDRQEGEASLGVVGAGQASQASVEPVAHASFEVVAP